MDIIACTAVVDDGFFSQRWRFTGGWKDWLDDETMMCGYLSHDDVEQKIDERRRPSRVPLERLVAGYIL